MSEYDFRMVAGNMGINLNFAAGSQIFKAGDPATHLYLIQSGAIDIVIHDKVTETCGPNDAIGLLSMVDNGPQGMTARVRQDAVVTAIDQRKFRFMIDEVPHFSKYIMGLMARRIRELGKSV